MSLTRERSLFEVNADSSVFRLTHEQCPQAGADKPIKQLLAAPRAPLATPLLPRMTHTAPMRRIGRWATATYLSLAAAVISFGWGTLAAEFGFNLIPGLAAAFEVGAGAGVIALTGQFILAAVLIAAVFKMRRFLYRIWWKLMY